MSKSAFISRALADGSPFQHLLLAAGFEVYGQSLLKFEPIAFSSPTTTDWVFCYSARSVDFFFNGLLAQGIPSARYQHFAALGSGTAKALLRWAIQPDFVGTGNPDETAAAFEQLARGKSVLFPRAEQSRQSVQRSLSDAVRVFDLVVYRNSIDHRVTAPVTRYVALTSPLNAEAYLQQEVASDNTRFVAIGKTTARALKMLEVSDFRIAHQSSEQGLAETIIQWDNERDG